MHPIVPFIDVSGTPTLGVTPGGVWFGTMVPQGCLAVFGGVADICPVGVAVILHFPPSWFVTRGGVCWTTDRVTDIT